MLHGKSKISDLDIAILDEDVGRFEIPVDYASGMDVIVSVDDLVHEADRIGLS